MEFGYKKTIRPGGQIATRENTKMSAYLAFEVTIVYKYDKKTRAKRKPQEKRPFYLTQRPVPNVFWHISTKRLV